MFNFLDCHKRRNPGAITFCWRLEVKELLLSNNITKSKKILLFGWERNHYSNYYKKTKSCNQLYSFLFYQNQIKHAMSELLTPLGFSLLTNYLQSQL